MNGGFIKQSRPEWQNISPEAFAAKLAAAKNLSPALAEQMEQQPRLPEMLWFIQAMGMQPGGLKKFCSDLLADNAGRIGPKAVRDLPAGKVERSKLERILRDNDWYFHGFKSRSLARCHRRLLDYPQWQIEEEERKYEEQLAAFTKEGMLETAHRQAESRFYRDLRECIEDRDAALIEPDYLPDFHALLLAKMDEQARTATTMLAQTVVVDKVFDALDYALSENLLVKIEGDSRHGKTESVTAWCNMRPGMARMVQTPCSNSDYDFFKAIADTIGIDYTVTVQTKQLRERVEYVLSHAGLMLVFDEAHFLMPQRFSQNTPPMRLNWIRTNLVDKGLPCAVVATPQAYGGGLKKYLARTGYSIEQWIGRFKMQVELPDRLSHADMLAVARVHFPEISEGKLELIVAKALQSPAYLQAMESIANRARYIATKAGRRDQVKMADIEQAIADTVPAVALQPSGSPAATSLPKRGHRPTTEVVEPFSTPSRGNLKEAVAQP